MSRMELEEGCVCVFSISYGVTLHLYLLYFVFRFFSLLFPFFVFLVLSLEDCLTKCLCECDKFLRDYQTNIWLWKPHTNTYTRIHAQHTQNKQYVMRQPSSIVSNKNSSLKKILQWSNQLEMTFDLSQSTISFTSHPIWLLKLSIFFCDHIYAFFWMTSNSLTNY